ncbi:hypothetical protein AB0K51_17100 [Kitasatospora sp. NPDC049285]|uniref:hypothetical protein n=1 Tax=Kitasatospora sp. NPDC049285 TaxID=3157096 RepID=UPI00341B9E27
MGWWGRRSRQPPADDGPFLALFLTATDLPGPVARICPPDGRLPPALDPPLRGVLRSGAAVWAAPGDAPLHRFDDLRWQFRRDRQARVAARRISAELACPAGSVAAVRRHGRVVARLVYTPGADPAAPRLAVLLARVAVLAGDSS